jgi:hypothetical protein
MPNHLVARLLAAGLALALGLPALAQTRHTFGDEPAPRPGTRYLLIREETVREEYRVRAGGRTVVESKERSVDFSAEVEVVAVRGGEVVEIEIAFRRASCLHDGRSPRLDLVGRPVRGVGPPGRRRFHFVAGPPPTEAERSFLVDQFGGSSTGPDPREIFAPPGPVTVGQEWEIPVEGLLRSFGLEAGSIAPGPTRARASLLEIDRERGIPFGVIDIEVDLVPRTFDAMRVLSGSIRIEGEILLPLDGALPDRRQEFDLDLDLQAEGAEDGLPVEVEMELSLSGFEERASLDRRR